MPSQDTGPISEGILEYFLQCFYLDENLIIEPKITISRMLLFSPNHCIAKALCDECVMNV